MIIKNNINHAQIRIKSKMIKTLFLQHPRVVKIFFKVCFLTYFSGLITDSPSCPQHVRQHDNSKKF